MPSILIIDDDTAVCASLNLLLRRAKYQVAAIHRPQDLDQALAEQEPDLVLLDMNFSISTTGKDGLKLLKQLRALRPNLPVILNVLFRPVELCL